MLTKYDALFAKIADDVLYDPIVAEPLRCFKSRIFSKVFATPVNTGLMTKDEKRALNQRAKEIFKNRYRQYRQNNPTHSREDFQQVNGNTKKYSRPNIAPRVSPLQKNNPK
jgi:hypothetical protein